MTATPRTHNADGQRARGTSNGNERGNVEQRRRRRQWLLDTFASDVKLISLRWEDGNTSTVRPLLAENFAWWKAQLEMLPALRATPIPLVEVEEIPTARCYRCGALLHDGTVTVDRIIPGCHGGTYARTNIRPACGSHNSSTGATLRKKG